MRDGNEKQINTSEKLANAPIFNICLKTVNSGIDSITSSVLVQNRDKTPASLKAAIRLIIENFIYSGDTVAVHMHYKYYTSMPKRYNPHLLKGNSIKKAVRLMEELGYLKVHLGFRAIDFKAGLLTRIEALPVLKTKLNATELEKINVRFHESREIIELKDKDKKLLDYSDSKSIKMSRFFLIKYNSFLAKQEVTFNHHEVCTKLKRVYNNSSLSLGGRFYGSFQNLRGRERREMLINGSPVIEIDYRGMHIQMLYAKCGLDLYNEDVYTIKGYERYRNIFKTILQIAINSKSYTSAVTTISFHLKDRCPGSNLDAKVLLDKFLDKHRLISKYFFSGVGLHLQNLDSQIAEFVLTRFYKKGKVALPVHDSFIVTNIDFEFLKESMDLASKKFLKVSLDTSSKK